METIRRHVSVAESVALNPIRTRSEMTPARLAAAMGMTHDAVRGLLRKPAETRHHPMTPIPSAGAHPSRRGWAYLSNPLTRMIEHRVACGVAGR
jgi:hypothetical protein